MIDFAQVQAVTLGQGNAGRISLKASDRVFISNNSFLSTSLVGADVVGDSSKIAIEGNSVSLTNGSQLQNSVSSGARTNQAGQISVKATDSVSLVGSRISIFSNVNPGGIGNSSNIFVSDPSVSLFDGAQLNSSNATGGNGGNITLQASEAITFTGTDDFGSSSGIITQAGAGNAGTIDLQAGSISLSDRAILSASNIGEGRTGDISLQAEDKISVSNSLISTSLGSIDGSKVTGTIEAISLEADSISITDDSLIQASIET